MFWHFVDRRNLLTNPFNCNCHLSWLGDWLQKKNIVTGNPRCDTPTAFQNSPIQDLKTTDFKCESKAALLAHNIPAQPNQAELCYY